MSETDLLLGQEAYIRYVAGIAVITNPEATSEIHNRPVVSAEQDTIAFHAEKLMFEGLKQVIRYSHPEEIRSNIGELEPLFDDAIPNIRAIVDSSYNDHEQRINGLNKAFRLLRPAPLYDPVVYRYICHGRLEKLSTIRMLGGFVPSAFFGNSLDDRNLTALSPTLRLIPEVA